MFDWKGKAGEMAVALKDEGLSANAIAARINKRFGSNITRNAVLGYFHRCGLCCKRDYGGRTAGALTSAINNRMKQRRRASKPPLEAAPLPRADDVARVAFADLEPHHCRFIPGDPAKMRGQPMFCGLPKHPGLSYCTGHAARCVPGLFVAPSPAATPVEKETEFA